MKASRFALLLTLALPFFAACSSTRNEPPPREDWSRRGRGGMSIEALDLALPVSWWHEGALTESLNLTGDQFQKLDALTAQQEDVARLERDSMMASRELRTSLDANNATAADVVAAGEHLRELRQTLLARQIEVLAAQREILTRDQWTALQRELAEERRPERGQRWDRGSRGRGGRGRGGGRRPGSW